MPLIGCASLDGFLNLSEHQCPHLKNQRLVLTINCDNEQEWWHRVLLKTKICAPSQSPATKEDHSFLQTGGPWLVHFCVLCVCRNMVHSPGSSLPSSFLTSSFSLNFSLSFPLFFPARPQAGAEGPKPHLLWLYMHSFKACFSAQCGLFERGQFAGLVSFPFTPWLCLLKFGSCKRKAWTWKALE